MTLALLSLGSNQQAEVHLPAAVKALRERFTVLRVSPAYRTPAVGFEGPDFLNAAVAIDSDLDPYALNAWLHALEDAQGRRRDGPRFSSRTLDIDIVFFGDQSLSGDGHLQVPRDDWRHAFVLGPLADIAPNYRHPDLADTLGALWRQHSGHGTLGAPVVIEVVPDDELR